MTPTRWYAAGLGLLVVLAVLLVPSASGGPTVPAVPDATGATGATGGRVVLVGTGGLSWNDVDEQTTPTLWSLLGAATATVTVRSVRTTTCPVDGWLSLSAGQRAADVAVLDGSGRVQSRPPCRAVPPSLVGGRVDRWEAYRRAAAETKFGARLGLLGDQVSAAGTCVQAVGPGAALAAARSDGSVARYAAYDAGALGRLVSGCRLTVVDVGSVRDPAEVHPQDEVRPRESRAAQVAAVDRRVGEVLAAVRGRTGATVVVASLSDAGTVERLRLAAVSPAGQGAALVSLSTRQGGLVQSADLTATLLAGLGLPVAAGVSGRALHRTDGAGAAPADRLRELVDTDLASHEVHALVPPFFNGWVFTQIAIYSFVALVWRRRWGTLARRLRLLRIARRVGVVAAAVPVSTFLANLLPWWRAAVPLLAVTASVALFVAALSALALLGPWRRSLFGPMAVVCLATVLVLALDVMKGSQLQVSSLMGLQPVVGGRFYGMGNVTFALFAAATLLLCVAVADHLTRPARGTRAAAAAVAAIGLTAVVIDGSPAWGADFGGPPAVLPGLAYLVLAVLGVRLTWRRAGLVLAATAAFLVLIGVVDWLRPAASRSHLGNFVQAVIDGGALDIVARKAAQNFAILTGSWLTLLVPVGLVFVIAILARPTSWGARALQSAYERAPLLRPGLVALLVTTLIGFALNDSGTAIPAVAGTVALPLVIAVCVQALQEESGADGRPAPPPQPRRAARHTVPRAGGSPG